jgi:hypothetical protein
MSPGTPEKRKSGFLEGENNYQHQRSAKKKKLQEASE